MFYGDIKTMGTDILKNEIIILHYHLAKLSDLEEVEYISKDVWDIASFKDEGHRGKRSVPKRT